MWKTRVDCFRRTTVSLEGERVRERFGQVIPPAIHAHAWLALCHAELGTFSTGLVCGQEAVRIAETDDRPLSFLTAYRGLGLLSLRQGNLHQALPILERAVGICQEADFQTYFIMVAPMLGAVYTLAGRLTDALPLLTQAVDQATALGAMGSQALRVVFLSEAYLRAGHLEDASTLAAQALGLSRTHEERGYQAYALRLLGDIAVHRNPPESKQADTHYRQALTLADELGMRPLQAHCHHGLGTVYSQTGRSEQARAKLSTAVEMYRDMEMTFWLPQAEAALAEVERR
jgi:tetratricopeptide (TPR) repeat protein